MGHTRGSSSSILQSAANFQHPTPGSPSISQSTPVFCRQTHKRSVGDSSQSPHSIIISPPSKFSPNRHHKRPETGQESPKLLNIFTSRRTSATSSPNVNHHHRFSIQSVLQNSIPSQRNSPGEPAAVSVNPTSPTPTIPSSSSHHSTHSSHRLSTAMKSLFNRKPSITSSSDSSFSNSSSHHSFASPSESHPPSHHHFTSPGLKVTNLPPARPSHTLRTRSSSGQVHNTYRRHQAPENNVDLNEAVEDEDEDRNSDNCPVCVEDLRMQLPGEKPLVVPKCGHRLHASCFEAVYGSLDHARRTGDVLGLCGICRKDMKLNGTGNSLSSKKFGLGNVHQVMPKHLRTGIPPPSIDNHKINSITRKILAAAPVNALDMADEDCDDDEEANLSGIDLEREDELIGLWHDVDSVHHQPHLNHPGGMENLRIDPKRNPSIGRRPLVKPTVNVIAENPNLVLNKDSDKSQHLTCMVTLELASLYPPLTSPTPFQPTRNYRLASLPSSSPLSLSNVPSKPMSDISTCYNGSSCYGTTLSYQDSATSPLSPITPATSQVLPSSKASLLSPSSQRCTDTVVRATPDRGGSLKFDLSRASSMNFVLPHAVHLDLLPPLPTKEPVVTQPLQPVLDDLLERMEDWKGHSSSDFGILKKCDRIYVEKEENCRKFLVYLFEEALLCVSQVRDHPTTPALSKPNKFDEPIAGAGGPPLKLKGRVYIRHMHSVSEVATNSSNMPSLRVKMKDEKLDAFIMRFEDRTRLEDWCTVIRSLINKRSPPPPTSKLPEFPFMTQADNTTCPIPPTPRSFSSQFAADPYPSRMVADTRSCKSDSLYSVSDRRPLSSNDGGSLFNGSTKTNLVTTISTLSSVGEEYTEPINSKDCLQPQSLKSGIFPSSEMNPALRSASLRHEFCPIDLTLIISIPMCYPMGSVGLSPSDVKLRLLKQSLQFLVYHLHPRSRLSLVAFTVGSRGGPEEQGKLLHTPFLIVGKPDSLKRIEFAIEQISRAGRTDGILTAQNWKYFAEDIALTQQPAHSQGDHNLIGEKARRRLQMVDRTESKVSVVTAVNLAYDMILPRKQKNPLSGILLLNDSRDCSTKPEMALVMTRAEAVHIPIQSIGWGETHNPSSLWQLSNHTGGTYTFVRDHHSIKEAIAGCVGGMLSVGMSNTRVSISIAETKWFKIKKISGVSHVVASDGQHADLDVGQLRFGERRDLLVEVEMRSAKEVYRSQEHLDPDRDMLGLEHGHKIETGTDAFFMSQVGGGMNVGILDNLDPFQTFYESQFDSMNDDVPLFEVNISYRDPQAGKNISRLPRPAVLMVTVTPPSVDSASPTSVNEPSIVKRRVELLTSDSLSRVLLLVSRRMDKQALRLMNETCRIVSALMFNLFQIDASRYLTDFTGPKDFGMVESMMKDGKIKPTLEHVSVFVILAGCLQVMKRVVEALDEIQTGFQGRDHLGLQYGGGHDDRGSSAEDKNQDIINQARSKFESSMKNFVAEQSGILRDQRTWLIHPAHLNASATKYAIEDDTSLAGPVAKEGVVSIVEEVYFRSDYSIWMKNIVENWMPER